jgi:hypothetical protein
MGRREWSASEALDEGIILMQIAASEEPWIESYGFEDSILASRPCTGQILGDDQVSTK